MIKIICDAFYFDFIDDCRGNCGTTVESAKKIVITDITGKMVFQSQVVINGNSVEVEFGDLATGMYLVMVGEERLRLVVE